MSQPALGLGQRYCFSFEAQWQLLSFSQTAIAQAAMRLSIASQSNEQLDKGLLEFQYPG